MAKKATPKNAMDYPEHEKTYDIFLKFAIWTTVGCIALLIAMAAGFFGGMGLFGGSIIFWAILALFYFVL